MFLVVWAPFLSLCMSSSNIQMVFNSQSAISMSKLTWKVTSCPVFDRKFRELLQYITSSLSFTMKVRGFEALIYEYRSLYKRKKTGIEIISFNHQSNVVFLKFISLSAELSLEHIQNHFMKNKAVLKPQVLSGFASVGKMAIKYIRLSMLVITYFFTSVLLVQKIQYMWCDQTKSV